MRRPRLTTDYNITPDFGRREPWIYKEWFADWPEGNGTVALYEPAATWFENALKSTKRPYEKRVVTWPDPSAMHVLGNLTKYTRDCHKNEPVAVFKAGLAQSACDEIMDMLNNFPCDCFYSTDLAAAAPSNDSSIIAALKSSPETPEIHKIAAHQHATQELREILDEAGVSYVYKSRHQLTLDEEVEAMQLLWRYAKSSEYTRLVYARGIIDVIELHKPQDICDRITAGTLCDPFLPEYLVKYERNRHTISEQGRFELDHLNDEILPLLPEADEPLPAVVELHIDEWLKEVFDAYGNTD